MIIVVDMVAVMMDATRDVAHHPRQLSSRD
jgi:hypothetical protein